MFVKYGDSKILNFSKYPFVSIIVPAYNEEKIIDDCIKSILKIDYPHYEVIIVDDNSSDKTVERGSLYPIKVLELKKNKGPGGARNEGAKISKGEILAFVDADCVVEKNWLKNLINTMSENMSIGCVTGKCIYLSNDSIPMKTYLNLSKTFLILGTGKYVTLKAHEKNNMQYIKRLLGSNFVIKKEIFKELNGFNESLFSNEDQEFGSRVIRKGWKIVYSPNAIVYTIRNLTFVNILKRIFIYGKYWAISNIKNRYMSLPHILPPIAFTILFILFISPYNICVYVFSILYFFLIFLASIIVFMKTKDIKLLFTVPVYGFLIHITYIFGYLFGFFKTTYDLIK